MDEIQEIIKRTMGFLSSSDEEAPPATEDEHGRKARAMASSGVPARYAAMDIDERGIPEEIITWRSRHGNLIIHGRDTGAGKTTAAIHVCRRIAATNSTFRFVEAAAIAIEVRGVWSSSDGSEAGIVRRLTQPDILIIDDMGTEQVTPATRQFWYAVINNRWGAEKRTVITTRKTLRELVEIYEGNIASRLLAGRTVEITGKDKRIFKA